MSTPTSPLAEIPSTADISISRLPQTTVKAADTLQKETLPPSEPSEASEAGHDYTENAPQAVVDAIAIERAREEQEGPPDLMVGSFQSWMGGLQGESYGCSHDE